MTAFLHFYQKERKLEKSKILRYAVITTLIVFCYEYLLVDPIAMQLGVGGLNKGFSNSDNIDVLSALVLALILEELFSRGFLSGKRKHFGFIFIQPIIGMVIFKEYWWVFMGIGLAFLVWVIHEQNKKPDDVYLSTPLFYTSFVFTTLFFTILHLGNVESSSLALDWTFTFAGILPGAIFFGWVRYQEGLGYSMLAHAVFNTLTITLNEILYL
ncbi:type II CAAX prenyl endopeptidase Rce1 family protein [Cecembia calidifontis]|uniref:CAAX prenyl protease-like protein n=1 Tax=Cecembia calidifontis TaxID=1187080 RepID=A0A4V2F6B3_9BACT|nr:CPBP family glutamic-type intramembrane protease [Cecembia calidifontis]RZS95719.1 CAAX prenyl protease-like protein [Cecembia calidifontis]